MRLIELLENRVDEIELGGNFDHDQGSELDRINYDDMNWYANGWLASEQDITSVGPKRFYIMGDDDPIGFAYTQFGDKPNIGLTAKTTMIWIDEEHRGEGLAGEYYDWLLQDLGRSLISDGKHSDESYQVWWKLVNKYESYLNGQTRIDAWETFEEAYKQDDAFIVVTPKERTTQVTPDPFFEDEYSSGDVDARRGMMRGDPVKRGTYMIYRACPADVTTFKPMDYVTGSRKFAIEHAQHQIAVEGEEYHVIRKMISQNEHDPILFHAPNTGELFYDGPEVAGKITKVSTEWE